MLCLDATTGSKLRDIHDDPDLDADLQIFSIIKIIHFKACAALVEVWALSVLSGWNIQRFKQFKYLFISYIIVHSTVCSESCLLHAPGNH